MNKETKQKLVPIWERINLTLEEAAAYSNIGINKLREITNGDNVKYTVPMMARLSALEKTQEIFFRVTKVFGEGSRVVITQGDKKVASFKRPYMINSKMEKIKIPVKLLEGVDPADGPLVVRAEEVAEEGGASHA